MVVVPAVGSLGRGTYLSENLLSNVTQHEQGCHVALHINPPAQNLHLRTRYSYPAYKNPSWDDRTARHVTTYNAGAS